MPINGYAAIQAVLGPSQQGPKIYLRSNAAMIDAPSPQLKTAAPAVTDDIYTASETPEARYGMSMQTLQLLKRYDIRDLKADEMRVLTGVISQDLKPGASSAIGGVISDLRAAATTINAIDVFTERQIQRQTMISKGLLSRHGLSEVLQEDDEALAALRHLASVHDALQKDDSVHMAGQDSVYQASQNAAFTGWAKERSLNEQAAALDSPPTAGGTATREQLQPDDKYVEIIQLAMKHHGMTLSATADTLSNSEKLDQAWKDYQKWQSSHRPLELKIDLEPEAEPKPDKAKQAPPARTAYTAAPYSRDQAEEKAPYGTASQEHLPLYQDDPEIRYGLSLQTLQLIKRTDVRNIAPEQLMKLSRLMQGRHEMTDDSANALLPIHLEIGQTEQRKAFDWFRTDEQRLLKAVSQGERLGRANPSGDMRPEPIVDASAAINSDRQAQSELQRLAELHDILQNDPTVQVAGYDGIQQATDIESFDAWVESQSMLDRNGKLPAMQYSSKESLTGIFRTLERIGVDLRKTDKDASASERLNLAWEDYQAWRGKHPNRRPEIELAPMPTVNTYI